MISLTLTTNTSWDPVPPFTSAFPLLVQYCICLFLPHCSGLCHFACWSIFPCHSTLSWASVKMGYEKQNKWKKLFSLLIYDLPLPFLLPLLCFYLFIRKQPVDAWLHHFLGMWLCPCFQEAGTHVANLGRVTSWVNPPGVNSTVERGLELKTLRS